MCHALGPDYAYIVCYGTAFLLLAPKSLAGHVCRPQVLHCCAILAPNQDVAFMLSIVWTAIQLFFSNYFIIFTEVEQQWITVLRWLSALFYAFEGLMTTEFQGVKLR
jgi:hypothetical protein